MYLSADSLEGSGWESPTAGRTMSGVGTRGDSIQQPNLIWLPHLKIYHDIRYTPLACSLREPTCSCSQEKPCGHIPLDVASSSPSPGHYHVLYQGDGESQVDWHGETYCMVGAYRTYGDIPLSTSAKEEAEEPTPQPLSPPRDTQEGTPKRQHTFSDSDTEQGCSRPKIQSLEPGDRRQKITG